ncbi:ATP-dependent nuclease [Stenotrophomonas pavanii]|uniref:ATP-dependent nuclease n=1 Tax=Stenotrophomonas pavanii TaxID=487698 RepID=UPI00088D2F84|nr:ATP-binding protein [Stenotrophomonas pavanii]SDK70629.1 AAA domain-containing protein [Stenotrophomonas pavanii]
MPRIRHIAIRNFRSIHSLDWSPSAGVNCLIGPGDSGKSTILDAIDLCLGARRSVSFGDADFHGLNVTVPIIIQITLGALSPSLMDLDLYGDFLRGFDGTTKVLEDEPEAGWETVLTLQLVVNADLDPSWSLFSDRAARDGIERSLPWKERATIAPAKIGQFAASNLSWSRGSVLNRLTEEKAELGAQLAAAGRDARSSFGTIATPRLAKTLGVVQTTAQSLGVSVGTTPQALLDAHAVSLGEGAIALHDEQGIPLRSLGTGSSRLLVAGLQRAAAMAAPIVLVDEVEYGLEPHRLMRLLDSLGAKETTPPIQAFLTSHSPVALRELSGDQLFVTRRHSQLHSVTVAGSSDEIQSTLRADPEAFLAKSVIVCEGASEVGFVRGLDLWGVAAEQPSFAALGGSCVNAGGGTPDNAFARATALMNLGYRVLVFIDADKDAKPGVAEAFASTLGELVTWRVNLTLEDELFRSLPDTSIDALLAKAKELVGEDLMDQHIKTRSNGRLALASIEAQRPASGYSSETREILGAASRIRGSGWFKSLTAYQDIVLNIVSSGYPSADSGFKSVVDQLWRFMRAT